MSRVEPNQPADKRESQDKLDRTPSKAEGDERTIDEALRNQGEQAEQSGERE